MSRILVIGDRGRLSADLIAFLQDHLADRHEIIGIFVKPLQWTPQTDDTLIYLAAVRGDGDAPDLSEAAQLHNLLAETKPRFLFLISTAAVFPARPGHTCMVTEDKQALPHHNSLSDQWQLLEKLFQTDVAYPLALLRTAPLLLADRSNFVSRLFSAKLAFVPLGQDPSLQVMGPEMLNRALLALLRQPKPGLFHLAPDGVIPLSRALKTLGIFRISLPFWLLGLTGVFSDKSCSTLRNLIRYPMTIGDSASRRRLGLGAQGSSAEHLLAFRGRPQSAQPDYDDFGGNSAYVDGKIRTLFRLLHDHYWRVEVKGVEHLSRDGAAVLVGVHRGFMPFDATMILTEVQRSVGRYVRFLVHPSLLKPPMLSNFIRRLGGVIADHDNADLLLSRGHLVGIYPEGISGAFTLYKNAYKLGRFGRDQYVRIALRNRVPLIPFVTVGSAEIFPIFGRIHWRWFKHLTEWPFLPITPTFPLIPLPLPSKWHTQYLEPFHIEHQYGPEVAEDRRTVRKIGKEVEARIQTAINEMRLNRRHIFWGNIFD